MTARSRRCCAGWPTATSPSSATANTTWSRGRPGMALRAVPGTGLGILRHDEPRADSLATLPPEVRAKAKEPVRLVLTKANSRSTVHRPYYLDYVALKRFDDSGEVVGEYRFLGLYTHVAYSESISHIPVLRRKLTERARGGGHCRRQPRRQGPGGDPRDLPAGGAVPDLGGRAHSDRARRAAAARAQADQAVPAQGPLRPVHDLPALPAAGPVEYQGAAADPGNPDKGAERCLRGLQRDDRRVRAGPAAGGGPRRSAGTRCPTWTRPSSSGSWRRPSGPGTTTCTRRRYARSARGRAARWSPRSPSVIPETYKADTSAEAAVADLRRITELRASGEPVAVELYQSTGHLHGAEFTESGSVDEDQGAVTDAPPRSWRLKVYRTRSSDHAVPGAAAAAAHGRGGGGRAPVRVRGPSSRTGRRSGSMTSGCAAPRSPATAQQAVKELFEDALHRPVARAHRGRQLQRAGAGRRAELAPGRRAARLRQVPAAGGHHVQPGLHRAGAEVERHHHQAPGPAVRVAVRPAADRRRGRAERGDRRGDPRRARRRGQPRPGPDSPLLPGPHRGHPADQLLPASGTAPRCRPAGTVPGHQAGPGPGARPARAQAAVRAVRVLAPVRGHPPAVRPGGQGRDPLVGPAGGLPHRGARPGEGAGREELRHRAGRRQGRASSASSCPIPPTVPPTPTRAWPATACSSAPCWTSPTTSAASRWCRRPRWSGTTATTPTWSSRRTRAPRRSPTWPTRSRTSTGSGSVTRSPPAARTGTTTRRWASPRGARGSRCASTSARSAP